jgi:hypothetical protein
MEKLVVHGFDVFCRESHRVVLRRFQERNRDTVSLSAAPGFGWSKFVNRRGATMFPIQQGRSNMEDLTS